MKLNSIQFFTNTSIMLSMAFIPLLAEDLGASYIQIGVIMSVFGLCLGVSSYMFSKAADSWNIKRLLLAGLACSAAAYLLQAFADDPLTLGLARGLLGICIGMYLPAVKTRNYTRHRHKLRFSFFASLRSRFNAKVQGHRDAKGIISVVTSFMLLPSDRASKKLNLWRCEVYKQRIAGSLLMAGG